MSLSPRESGVRQAGSYLRELLQGEPYRYRWMRYLRRRERELHQISVAKVLAEYLRNHGDDDVDYAQLTRRVSRAFRGEVLSRQTLQLFVAAFDIADEHAAILWRQWEGVERPRVVIGELPAPADVAEPSYRYKTVALSEFHYLGHDGQPLRHRTVRGIQALEDRMATYRYSFDTGEVTVDRIGGGKPGIPYHRMYDIWSVDIALPRLLNHHEEHLLEFETTFHYRRPVEPCFRRAAHERLENVAIRVEFHPEMVPDQIWWTEWKDYREPNIEIVHRVPVLLDAERVAYHRLDVLDRAVVGFEWRF